MKTKKLRLDTGQHTTLANTAKSTNRTTTAAPLGTTRLIDDGI